MLLPSIPEEKKSVIQTELGSLDDYTFTARAKLDGHQTAYITSYADYPAGSTQKLNPNDFLEKTWQGGYGNLGDRLIYKKSITLNNFAGIEFQYKGSNASTFVITARSYLVNDRVYQLSTVIHNSLLDKGYAQKYLDSFRLLK